MQRIQTTSSASRPMRGSLAAHLAIFAVLTGFWGAGPGGDQGREAPVIQVLAAAAPAALAQQPPARLQWEAEAPAPPQVRESAIAAPSEPETIACDSPLEARLPELVIEAGAPLPPRIPHREVPAPVVEPEPLPSTVALASTTEPQRVAAHVLAATCPTPPYPRLARRRGLEGLTVLLLQVAADGRVTSARVAESSGHAILDEAALAAVRAWRLTPATEDGRAIADTIRVPMRFRLEG